MTIEMGILIAVLASFGLGLYLGHRGKPALNAQVSTLKAKVRAMDQSLAQALDSIRNYRRSDEEYSKSTVRLAEQNARQEKLLERIKEALADHRMTYDDIMGWLKPIQGDEYTYKIDVVRKSSEDLERMHQVRNLTQQRPEPKQAVQATAARQHSSPVIPNYHRTDHYRRDDSNDTVSMVTQAAVLSSVMDTSHHHQSSPEPSRCDPSPSYSNDFDSGSCSSPSFD